MDDDQPLPRIVFSAPDRTCYINCKSSNLRRNAAFNQFYQVLYFIWAYIYERTVNYPQAWAKYEKFYQVLDRQVGHGISEPADRSEQNSLILEFFDLFWMGNMEIEVAMT